jgi:hypothetical protein
MNEVKSEARPSALYECEALLDTAREQIESLEQMRSLDQNAIEAKDHKIVLLEQANAKLEGEINRLNQKYDFQLLVKSNEELKRQLDKIESLEKELSERSAASYFLKNVQMAEQIELLKKELELQKVGCAAFKKFADDLEQENRELKDFKKATESIYKRYEQANAKLEREKDQLFEIWQKNDWNLNQENAKLKAEIDSLKLKQLVKTEE